MGGWSALRPGRFTPGKETRYPLYRRLVGRHGQSGRVRKISPPPGFEPQTTQSITFNLDAGLLARSQYSEGPATGHLDTGFSWFS